MTELWEIFFGRQLWLDYGKFQWRDSCGWIMGTLGRETAVSGLWELLVGRLLWLNYWKSQWGDNCGWIKVSLSGAEEEESTFGHKRGSGYIQPELAAETTEVHKQ